MGSDRRCVPHAWPCCYFNPRSPDGERLGDRVRAVAEALISIHAPRMGSDLDRNEDTVGRIISIHAPRMGSDTFDVSMFPVPHAFQSTLPGWGATLLGVFIVPHIIISIHAPRMGSDLAQHVAGVRFRHFNPRSPDGERPRGTAGPDTRDDFNPRSPDGERRGGGAGTPR